MGRKVKRVSMNFDWFEKTSKEDGIAETWAGYMLGIKLLCPLCDGEGVNSKKVDCDLCYGDKYVIPEIEPPSGDGWQMWENVSEGSPISPVFETKEELAQWLADNNASAMGEDTATYDQWLTMIEQGYAPSMVCDGEKLMSGVEAASNMDEK